MRARRLAEPVDAVDRAAASDDHRRGALADRRGSLISAIVPMFQDRADVVEVYRAYKAAIAAPRPAVRAGLRRRAGEHGQALGALRELKASGEEALVVVVGQQLDEAKALMSGFARRGARSC